MCRCRRVAERAALAAALALSLAASLATAGEATAGERASLPQPLQAFDARYAVTRSGMRLATMRMRLAPHSAGWRYSSRTDPQGIAQLFIDGPSTEETLLEGSDGGLRPLRYRHVEPDAADRLEVHFDWAEQRARVQTAAGERSVAIETGTHDPFSAVLAVMQGLASGQERIELPGIDNDGERSRLAFAVRSRETIRVPLGEYETARVYRIRDDKRKTITWLAPELGWLPVRLEQRAHGDLVARAEIERLDAERTPGADTARESHRRGR